MKKLWENLGRFLWRSFEFHDSDFFVMNFWLSSVHTWKLCFIPGNKSKFPGNHKFEKYFPVIYSVTESLPAIHFFFQIISQKWESRIPHNFHVRFRLSRLEQLIFIQVWLKSTGLLKNILIIPNISVLFQRPFFAKKS